MKALLKLDVIVDEKEVLSFETSTTTISPATLTDLIGLVDASIAWLQKQKTELEKLPPTQQLKG